MTDPDSVRKAKVLFALTRAHEIYCAHAKGAPTVVSKDITYERLREHADRMWWMVWTLVRNGVIPIQVASEIWTRVDEAENLLLDAWFDDE